MLVLCVGFGAGTSGAAQAQADAPPEAKRVGHTAPALSLTPRAEAVTPAVRRQVEAAVAGADGRKSGSFAKIGRALATLYFQHEAEGAAGVRRLVGGSAKRYRQTPRARVHSPVSGDGTHVTVNAVATGDPSALQDALEQLGLENGARVGRLVSGRFPIAALGTAARLPSLQGMLPAYVRTHVGSVTSEADTAHDALGARSTFGVNGSGQKVCALSDSYNNPSGTVSTTASDDVQSGDLPGTDNPDGFTTPVDVLDDSESGGDEGRAMLQLIHDLAPGAELGFHTAFGGFANFAEGIRELADAGCTIIVDDVAYGSGPFYQDGLVAQAVDDVVSEGVAYFSSAGNNGQNAYKSAYRPTTQQGALNNSNTLHDFEPGAAVDTLQEVRISAPGPNENVGGTFQIFTFQWTDPSPARSGGSGTLDTDLDIALLNDTLGVVASSTIDNPQLGLVFETLAYTNDGTVDTDADGVPDSTFHLTIERAAGPAPDSVQYIYTNTDASLQEYDTRGPTVYGHPMAEGAMAVAAAPFYNTDAYNSNVASAVLNSFSSRGGLPILFDTDGNPVSPTVRPKPDVTGVDGADNTFFGDDLSDSFFNGIDGDPHPNFFGTSAAAPHVAAIGALVKENRPGLTVQQLYDELEGNALDVTRRYNRNGSLVFTNANQGQGFDYWGGNGFVQAESATLPVELTRFEAVADEGAAVLTWRTASEQDNAGFAVQHRRGDGAFETLGFVEGAGTTREPQSYRFRASDLRVGTHTFRLRQVDTDGAVRHSEPVTAEIGLDAAYRVTPVTPNPVRGRATVQVTVQRAQPVQVTLHNALGQQVATLHDARLAANTPITLRLEDGNRPSGVYFVRVRGTTFTTTRRFVHVQ
jgi:hypothetical protein